MLRGNLKEVYKIMRGMDKVNSKGLFPNVGSLIGEINSPNKELIFYEVQLADFIAAITGDSCSAEEATEILIDMNINMNCVRYRRQDIRHGDAIQQCLDQELNGILEMKCTWTWLATVSEMARMGIPRGMVLHPYAINKHVELDPIYKPIQIKTGNDATHH
eukprot:g40562.t1